MSTLVHPGTNIDLEDSMKETALKTVATAHNLAIIETRPDYRLKNYYKLKK